MPENPYRGRGASMLGFRGYEEKAYDRGFVAGEAAERERIVKLLRSANPPGNVADVYQAMTYAADLIERTAKENDG